MLINKIISTLYSKKRKSQYKNAFTIFAFITKIYSKSMGFLEDLFYKNKKYQRSFYKTGIFKFEIEFNANNFIKNVKKLCIDESLSIYCLSEEEVNRLIKKVFDTKTKSLLYQLTGFKYSVDYLRIYENNHISKGNTLFKNLREAHFDKAFSKNMLKIFIPLNVDSNSGPLKVNLINSRNFSQAYENDLDKFYFVTGKGELIYGVLPNLCWHQEGNPKKEFSAKQIMFQLNPSNRWEFREDIYLRQLKTENKFPSFSSFFFKKIIIN